MFTNKVLVLCCFINLIQLSLSKSLDQCSVRSMGKTNKQTFILSEEEGRKTEGVRIMQKIKFAQNNIPRVAAIEALQSDPANTDKFEIVDAYNDGKNYRIITSDKQVLVYDEEADFSNPPISKNELFDEFERPFQTIAVGITFVAATYVHKVNITIVVALGQRTLGTRLAYHLYYTGGKILNPDTDLPNIKLADGLNDARFDSLMPTAIDYVGGNDTHYMLRLAYGRLVTSRWYSNSAREVSLFDPNKMNFRLADEFIEGCLPQICFDSDLTGAASVVGKHYDLYRGTYHWRFPSFDTDTSLVIPKRTEKKPDSDQPIYVEAAFYIADTLYLIEGDQVFVNGKFHKAEDLFPGWTGPIWAAVMTNELILVGPDKTYGYNTSENELGFTLANNASGLLDGVPLVKIDAILKDIRSYIAFTDNFYYRIRYTNLVVIAPRSTASALLNCTDSAYQNLTLPKAFGINSTREYLLFRRAFLPPVPDYPDEKYLDNITGTTAEELDIEHSVGARLLIVFAGLMVVCFIVFIALLYIDVNVLKH